VRHAERSGCGTKCQVSRLRGSAFAEGAGAFRPLKSRPGWGGLQARASFFSSRVLLNLHSCFLLGHGFSRADKANKMNGALAPAGCISSDYAEGSRVPHPRRVFVFAARVGKRTRYSIAELNLSSGCNFLPAKFVLELSVIRDGLRTIRRLSDVENPQEAGE